jgi:hypothetical protein
MVLDSCLTLSIPLKHRSLRTQLKMVLTSLPTSRLVIIKSSTLNAIKPWSGSSKLCQPSLKRNIVCTSMAFNASMVSKRLIMTWKKPSLLKLRPILSKSPLLLLKIKSLLTQSNNRPLDFLNSQRKKKMSNSIPSQKYSFLRMPFRCPKLLLKPRYSRELALHRKDSMLTTSMCHLMRTI